MKLPYLTDVISKLNEITKYFHGKNTKFAKFIFITFIAGD